METDLTPVGFFNFKFAWEKNIPKFSIKLKDEFAKICPKRSDGMPFSSAQFGYFECLFERELAQKLFAFRKPFFNKDFCTKWFLDNEIISKDEYCLIEISLQKMKDDCKHKHQVKMSSPEVLAKIRISNNRTAKTRGQTLKKTWADPVRRKSYLNAIHTDEAKEKRKISFRQTIAENYDRYVTAMNMPERLAKISTSSKAMWAQRKIDKTTSQFLPKSGARNYTVNSIKMNFPESFIANILNEKNIRWEYETELCNHLPDFYLPDYQIVIEHFGSFWHANPKLYQASDVIFDDVLAENIWQKDKQRILDFENANLKTLIIWETDLSKSSEMIDNLIQEKKI